MRSKVADEVREEQRKRVQAMTPAERVALARKLGEQGLAAYMAANNLTRAEAVARVKAARARGRRPSRVMGSGGK